MARRYWLMKSEPETYSIDDLARDGTTCWNGVRNYQARNLLRDELTVGDHVLFYHSNADPPGVVGLARVVRAGYPDHTQFDAGSDYHDPAARPDDPTWYMVDLTFVDKFPRVVGLDELKRTRGLEHMMVTRRGARFWPRPAPGRAPGACGCHRSK